LPGPLGARQDHRVWNDVSSSRRFRRTFFSTPVWGCTWLAAVVWDGTERTLIRIDPAVPPGDYALKVAMLLPERPGRNILLGIAGRDAEDRYRIGSVSGAATSRPTGVVYAQGFEADDYDWSVASGIEAALDTGTFHGGKAGLRLSGVQQGAWNYAAHYLEMPVLPGSKYRLSCWLKVDALEPVRMAPYLKIGLTGPDGAQLENCHTNRYDMSAAGTWQRLEGTFETPLETAGGHLALERGSKDVQTRIKVWIDDVELTLLEAP